MTDDTNNALELDKEKRVDEAKSRAMSKERKAITDLFNGIQFKYEDFNNKNTTSKSNDNK